MEFLLTCQHILPKDSVGQSQSMVNIGNAQT